jgi:hypothetical protein
MQDLASKAHRGIGFVTYEHSGTIGVLLNFPKFVVHGTDKILGNQERIVDYFSRATLV